MTSGKNILLGFIAGAIATLTIHELVKWLMVDAGFLPATLVPWSMEAVAITGLPKIVSSALWGGIWGVIFALTLGALPSGSMTLKGALMGIVGPALIGVFIALPIIKSTPLFMGGDPAGVAAVLLILAAFGAMTAWLYGFFTSGCRLP